MKHIASNANPELDWVIINGIKTQAFIPVNLKKTLKKKGDAFIFC